MIEAGRVEEQPQRGESEVSAQMRQIRIRQITSRIHQLQGNSDAGNPLLNDKIAREILQSLENWRNSIPVVANPRNTYESAEWMELNYQREKMNCLTIIAPLDGRDSSRQIADLRLCLDAAVMVVQCYQALSSSDRSVMNWTCVQDILRSGFTILYCLHAMSKSQPGQMENSTQPTTEQATASDAIRTCSEFLCHIAQRWHTVERHARIFENMSSEISRQVSSMHDGQASNNLGAGNNTLLEPHIALDHMDNMVPNGDIQFEDFNFGNVDFDALNWDGIFASGNQSINLDDFLTL